MNGKKTKPKPKHRGLVQEDPTPDVVQRVLDFVGEADHYVIIANKAGKTQTMIDGEGDMILGMIDYAKNIMQAKIDGHDLKGTDAQGRCNNPACTVKHET